MNPFNLVERKPAGILLGMALAAFVLTRLLLRHGVSACSDSWFYWEGSVDLLEHHTYTTFMGYPIEGWPPLFSLFLAAIQAPLGQTGAAIVMAMSILSAGNAFIWGAYVFKVFPPEERRLSSSTFVGSLLFVVFFVCLTTRVVFAHLLLLCFLGLLFNYAASLGAGRQAWGNLRRPAVAGLILLGAFLSHNSTIVFVVAFLLVFLVNAGGTWKQRVLASILILALSVIPWIAVRHWLGQMDSHSISKPRDSFAAYLQQLPCEIGTFFVPAKSLLVQGMVGSSFLAAAFFFFARPVKSPHEANQRVLLSVALLALLGHFLLFNIVWIDSALGGRFDWYAALSIAPILLFRARRHLPLAALLLALSVGVSGWRVAKYIIHPQSSVIDISSVKRPSNFIASDYFLSSMDEKPVPAKTFRILPPVFSFETITPGTKISEQEPCVLLYDGNDRNGH